MSEDFVNEFDFDKAYSEVDELVRPEVKGVMDFLLENCHSIDVMEDVLKEVNGVVKKLHDWSKKS